MLGGNQWFWIIVLCTVIFQLIVQVTIADYYWSQEYSTSHPVFFIFVWIMTEDVIFRHHLIVFLVTEYSKSLYLLFHSTHVLAAINSFYLMRFPFSCGFTLLSRLSFMELYWSVSLFFRSMEFSLYQENSQEASSKEPSVDPGTLVWLEPYTITSQNKTHPNVHIQCDLKRRAKDDNLSRWTGMNDKNCSSTV